MAKRRPRLLLPMLIATSAHGFTERDPVGVYLRQFGLLELPQLSVRYGDVLLDDDRRNFKLPSRLLQRMPTITWNASIDCAMLLFVDLDAGGRPESDLLAGSNGPFVHSLWTHCPGSILGCRVVKRYLAPGTTAPRESRYVYLLFRHACDAELKLPQSFKWGTKFSIATLLAENKNAGLSPVAYNYMLVSGAPAVAKRADKRVVRGK
ncbi:hypothetical protein AB1Y20_013324 [Prymnesium parvum]|uniref:Uncharacterized protein n=1 Tax=Prymnesium parvum TaxID=97485 RepID=A0AB34ILU3_PRYPA